MSFDEDKIPEPPNPIGVDQSSLGKIIVLETAKGEFNGIGQMVGYSYQPTVYIRFADGSQASWSAALTREATPEEIKVVQALAPEQNTCTHDPSFGRLTRTTTVTVCGRCRKAMSE
jgi:hypothetical protein